MKKWLEQNALIHAGNSALVANVSRILTAWSGGFWSSGAGVVAMFGNLWRSFSAKALKNEDNNPHLKKTELNLMDKAELVLIKTQISVPGTARLSSAGMIGWDGHVHHNNLPTIEAAFVFGTAAFLELFGNKSIKAWQASAVLVFGGSCLIGAAAEHQHSIPLGLNAVSLGYSAVMQFLASPQRAAKYANMVEAQRAFDAEHTGISAAL